MDSFDPESAHKAGKDDVLEIHMLSLLSDFEIDRL